jgi:hypothetical protein
MVTVEGTLAAAVLELDSDTAAPPLPAAAVRVTVPVPDWPPTIALGLTETPLKTARGSTVTLNVVLAPEYEAVKVAVVEELTVPAVTVNVAEVEPCGIFTIAGTLAAAELELDSETPTPPVPAAAVRVMVPVADWPPTMVAGLTDTLPNAAAAGLTVTPKVVLTPE